MHHYVRCTFLAAGRRLCYLHLGLLLVRITYDLLAAAGRKVVSGPPSSLALRGYVTLVYVPLVLCQL